MSFNPTKTQLRAASITMLVVALTAITLAIFVPVKQEEQAVAHAARGGPSSVPASQPSQIDALDFSDVMEVTLRKPLAVAHAATGPAIMNGDSTAGLKLVGTILEPLHSYAIFTSGSGKTEMKSVGEKVGLADISSIGEDSVTLRSSGRLVVLHAVRTSVIGGTSF